MLCLFCFLGYVSFGFLLPNDLLLARPKRRQKCSHSTGEMARSNGNSLQICKFRLYALLTSETFSTASKFDDGCHPILCNCPALMSLLRRGRLTSHIWVSARPFSVSWNDLRCRKCGRTYRVPTEVVHGSWYGRIVRLSRVSGRLPIISWWQKM